MGVPTFFRWIAKKYPKITSQVVELQPTVIDGQEIPVDITQPNPNQTEFDNLYLDMNGIIHPCAHPEDKPAPETEEEMYIEIFKYIDRIVTMIRPRKVLYMAIDGVAPRAKMNQQRSRRFRSAQEERIKREADERVRQELIKAGTPVAPKSEKKPFDSNCITPGTPFMAELAVCLRYYISERLTNNPGWKNLKVVLSDASVPGEGEHKIMDYIRSQRIQPDYNPNTSHVLYGLDADLIMLALATHEPHFKILREDVFFNEGKQRKCFVCNQTGHTANECTGELPPTADEESKQDGQKEMPIKPFVFLHIATLREYLDVELRLMDVPFRWDLERAIDDWVFMCFFVGNDFLPHLPSLEIREGAIDTLVSIWKKNLPRWGGYITDSGDIAMNRVQEMLVELGAIEDNVFRKRREDEERKRESRRAKKEEVKRRLEARLNPGKYQPPVTASVSKSLGKQTKDGMPYVAQQMSDFDLLPVKGVSVEERAEGNRRALEQLKRTGASRDQNKNAAELLKAKLSSKKGNVSPKTPSETKEESKPIIPQKRELEQEKDDSIDEETGEEIVDEEIVEECGGTALPVSQQNSSIPRKSESPLSQKATIEAGFDSSADEEKNGDADALIDASVDDVEVEDEAIVDPSKEPVEDEEEEEEEEELIDSLAVESPPKLKQKVVDSDDEVDANDEVKLWQSGWKERFYRSKFQVELADIDFRKRVVTSYMEGLCWVLKYYYQGCQSWTWFYPYHYAPFASDCDFVGSLKIRFELGKPFLPFAQLMGVLPAASGDHIPAPLRELMSGEDSSILDFYPEEFPIDLNGKKYLWQGVAILPFIDEKRLLDAIEPLYDRLSPEEKIRNSHGSPTLWVSGGHSMFDVFCVLYGRKINNEDIALDPKDSDGLFGSIAADPHACMPGCTFESPLTDFGLPDISDVNSLSVLYHLPSVPAHFRYPAKMLEKVQLPPFVLTPDDHYAVRNGLNNPYGRHSRRGGYQGQRGGFQGGPGHIHPSRGGRNGFSSRASNNPSNYYDNNNNSRNDYYYKKRPRYTPAQINRNRFDEPYMGGGGYYSASNGSRGAGYTPTQSYGSGHDYHPQQGYGNVPNYQQSQTYTQSYASPSQSLQYAGYSSGSDSQQIYRQPYQSAAAPPPAPGTQVSGSQVVANLLSQLNATHQQQSSIQPPTLGPQGPLAGYGQMQQYTQYNAGNTSAYQYQSQQQAYNPSSNVAINQYSSGYTYNNNSYNSNLSQAPSYPGQPAPSRPQAPSGGNIGWARNLNRGRGR